MAPVVIDVQNADDNRDIVHRAVEALAAGKIVAFPTETVYGLAASADSTEAVEQLSRLKVRGENEPFTLAVKSSDAALDYVPSISDLGRRLARRCWPGPITLVLDNGHPESLLGRLSPAVQQSVSPQGTIGLRVPAHQLILDALRLSASPVVLTSANRSGQPDALQASEIVSDFPDEDITILDDGPSRFGQPSSVVQVEGNRWRLLREGVLNESRMKWFANGMVVFVCTGNTCRSPMAEALFRQRAADRIGCAIDDLEDRGVMVLSAGIAAMQGGRSSPEAVSVMAERKIDISGHSSQPLSEQLVRFADMILTMTRGHRHAIVSRWPEVASRVSVLCRDGADVADPIGGPFELYGQCAMQIDDQLDGWLNDLNLNDLPTLWKED